MLVLLAKEGFRRDRARPCPRVGGTRSRTGASPVPTNEIGPFECKLV